MTFAFWCSVVGHIILYLLFVVGIKNPFKSAAVEEHVVLVEFANVDDKTRAPVLSSVLPDKKPDFTQPDQNAASKVTEPQQDHVEQKAQAAEDEKISPPVQESSKQPEPNQEEILKEKEQAEALALEKKKKEREQKREKEEKLKKEKEKKKQIEEKQKEEKKKKEQQDAIQKKKKEGEKKAVVNLDQKDKKTVQSDKKDPKKKKKEMSLSDLLNTSGADSKSNKSGAPAEALGDVYTASELSILKSHFSKCWNVPTGGKNAHEHKPQIEIEINEKMNVIKADIVEKERMRQDPFFRVAAEAAQRAVLDPECVTLPFDASRFKKFKNFVIEFDPSQMF